VQIVEDGFEIDLYGPRGMLVRQAMQGFDAVMPSKRFQGAPGAAAFGKIAYPVFQGDFHLGMGSAHKKSEDGQLCASAGVAAASGRSRSGADTRADRNRSTHHPTAGQLDIRQRGSAVLPRGGCPLTSPCLIAPEL
jgi:hypothetical protein